MAAGIRHGVHHYEALELLHPPHRFSFGVRFNEATRTRLLKLYHIAFRRPIPLEYAAKALPPQKFEPVGVAFIRGSISVIGLAEALVEHGLKDHPLRPLFAAERAGGK